MRADHEKIVPSIGAEDGKAARTISLPGIGVEGQDKISAARVVVIGAGGLGSPVLQYLAAVGIGILGIVDFDLVDRSNLQRQVIHSAASVGMLKTESAALAVAALDPAVVVVQHPVRLDRGNALEILGGYDLVVDASDNFATRYLVSDAAALLRIPYVWGSVLQFDGQLSVFWEGAPDGTSVDYRDLHPVPPDPSQVLSCAEAGVLGSLCGTIGSMMATEVVKLTTGVGVPLLGRVQNVDALTGEWSSFDVVRSPARIPVTGLIDYDEFCGTPAVVDDVKEVSAADLAGALEAGATLIDVREPYEHEVGHIDGDRLIPLGELNAHPSLAGGGPVVVYCATGARSRQAARMLAAQGVSAVSLRGGFIAWRVAGRVAGG
jgi:molybdopterin/thiamine biosynthesis adenylyltransferase/rhodanese-related sulfurtransferase